MNASASIGAKSNNSRQMSRTTRPHFRIPEASLVNSSSHFVIFVISLFVCFKNLLIPHLYQKTDPLYHKPMYLPTEMTNVCCHVGTST